MCTVIMGALPFAFITVAKVPRDATTLIDEKPIGLEQADAEEERQRDLALRRAMMPAIMIAAPFGVRAGHCMSEVWLRRIYTVLLFVIAADLIRKLAG